MKRTALVGLALCVAASAFAQGLYWQSRTEGTVGERVSEMYAMPRKMKVVQQGDREHPITIIRLDREVLWQLNPEKKTYSEMTFAQMEAMMSKAGGKMDAAKAKMQEQMKNMPEEQRKMMEKMMGERMPGMSGTTDAAVEVRNTGERKTISGFACTKYTVAQGENTIMTLWVTRDVRGFNELREDWKALSRRMAAMTARFGKEMADAYKNIDGFPIQTEMGHGVITTVTRVERRSTPASEFEIPAGYAKVRSEMDDAMEKMEKEEE
ncbi:MAG: DUF4412 domain-containing protein [Bacteroidota bacterium]